MIRQIVMSNKQNNVIEIFKKERKKNYKKFGKAKVTKV